MLEQFVPFNATNGSVYPLYTFFHIAEGAATRFVYLILLTFREIEHVAVAIQHF